MIRQDAAARRDWMRWLTWGVMAIATVTVAIRLAAPIRDSDVFWQMAYARQMLERGTLVLDHTAFSWTPTSNATIYCAWLAEFALFGLWRVFGLTGLFALRYAALGTIALLLWRFARRSGVEPSPVIVFVLLLVTLGSVDVVSAKPELFSVLFTHLVLWAYFNARRAERTGTRGVAYLAALPLILLVWVNTHGGFILVTPILAALCAGELLNAWLSPAIALAPGTRNRLLTMCGLCAIATVVSPYGFEYPRQLVSDYVLSASARPDVSWNSAHQSVFSAGGRKGHWVPALGIMLVTLGALGWRSRGRWRTGVDWVTVLLLLFTLPLYVLYLRSTYVFVAVFGYVAIGLAAPALPRADGERRAWRARSGCALLVAAIGTFIMNETVNRPRDRFGWFGFGISALNPVEETAYLEHAGFRGNLYNTFETGGYVLWKLQPDVKVMVDARSFPYLAWFDDHLKLVSGGIFEEFLRKYPNADVALIDYAKGPLLRNFARSSQWRLVFVGPSASVFVRVTSNAAQRLPVTRSVDLSRLHNAAGALAIFDFARFAGDYQSAWLVVDQLQSTLATQARDPELRQQVEAAADYRSAHQAARDGRYSRAYDLLNLSMNRKVISQRETRLLALLLALAGEPSGPPGERFRLQAQLRPLLAPFE